MEKDAKNPEKFEKSKKNVGNVCVCRVEYLPLHSKKKKFLSMTNKNQHTRLF